MPAGDRNVNASVCTTRDRSNYLVKSRESSFPTPAQTPVNVIPVVRGIFLTQRRSNYCAGRVSPSLSFCRTPRATRLFCKHSESTWAHGDAENRLIIGALEGSLFFIVPRSRRIALAEKFRRNLERVAGNLLFASAIDASPISRASQGTV